MGVCLPEQFRFPPPSHLPSQNKPKTQKKQPSEPTIFLYFLSILQPFDEQRLY